MFIFFVNLFLYRGLCTSRQRDQVFETLNQTEKKTNEQELQFSFSRVKFQKYRAAVKKYGHQSCLSDQHLRAICDLINLDIDMMLKDPKFPDAIIYNDANFTRKGDSIIPQKLLIIGYLYCHFSDVEEHANDMWLLINPRLNENITKASVKEFVEDLFYVAVDQRLKIFEAQEQKDPIVNAHLEECLAKKQDALQRVLLEFPHDSIDRNTFLSAFGKQFLRGYGIRQFIVHNDLKLIQDDENELKNVQGPVLDDDDHHSQNSSKQVLSSNANGTSFYQSILVQQKQRFLNQVQKRTASMFQTKQVSQSQGYDPERKRSYQEILQSIDSFRQKISEKTAQGRELSQQIANDVQPDKFLKLQRYEVFINKMEHLYKSELRFKRKQKKKHSQMINAHVYSQTPLKDILRNYNELSVRGFSGEIVVDALQTVNKALRARGQEARTMGDYTISDLDQSWRMQKLIDDIKIGLQEEQFFSPTHLAQTCQLLGEIGYKNTDLIPLFYNKLQFLLKEKETGQKKIEEFKIENSIYGGSSNTVARHYVFSGFQNDKEFNEYLGILMEWEGSSHQPQTASPSQTQEQQNIEAQELEFAVKDIIDTSVQIKELQKDYQSSIDSLRQQYFKMLEATDKYQFIVENPYIKYDLLELQEQLVKGGYIDPDEASQHLANESIESRMERASSLFYDYVLNYSPELLSPQHENFYQISKEEIEKSKPQKKLPFTPEESQNILNLSTFSQILTGISSQVFSYRPDAVKKDYLNKFYEEYLMPHKNLKEQVEFMEKHDYPTVMMEREYLRGWKVYKEQTAKILPSFIRLIREETHSLEGILDSLQALGASRHQLPQMQLLLQHALSQSKVTQQVSLNSIINGLQGLAYLTNNQMPEVSQLAKNITKNFDISQLSFVQQIDTLWSLVVIKEYDNNVTKQLLNTLNNLPFERVQHDIKYEEFQKIQDIHLALKTEKPDGLKLENKGLQLALVDSEFQTMLRYPEDSSHYDPFKNRVIQGISKGLGEASIDHQSILENELHNQQNLEYVNKDKYPYKPDIMLGYKGQKVGVFVLTERDVYQESLQPNGLVNFKRRVLEKANNGELKTVVIPIQSVINYDLEGMRVSFNKDFDFKQELESQLGTVLAQQQNIQINLDELIDFGQRFIKIFDSYAKEVENTPSREFEKINGFLRQLYRVFNVKQQTDLRVDKIQKSQGLDQLKFQLLKLNLIFQSLSKQAQQLVNKSLQLSSYQTFSQLLQKMKDHIPQAKAQKVNDKNLSQSWFGSRLEVELPVGKDDKIKKSIVPEIINQRFMWVDDYFHYEDWKKQQQKTYDNFNLLVIPPHKDEGKYFYDRENNHRRIPKGIFPFPNHKREIIQPNANKFASFLVDKEGNDPFTLFEKEPYKVMVLNELKKSEKLQPVSDEVSMITNLQNIKQSLKSDYNDQEVLNILLLNLNFTEQLIEEHLGLKRSNPKKAEDIKYLPRDTKIFRDFVQKTYFSKDQEDPYTDFYIKELAKKERIIKLYEEGRALHEGENQVLRSADEQDKAKQKLESLQDKIDNLLLANELENEDLTSLSHALRSNVEIKYDLSTLMKSEFVYDVEPELQDEMISNDEYLDIQRRRAETKLIKTKIIYKIYQGKGGDLTQNEKLYLKTWLNDVNENKQRNVLNLRDSLVQNKTSQLTIGDLEAKSIYTLNSVSKVQLDRDRHSKFALNDLVLEISHFLDEEVVNKVEMEIFQERLKKEWSLSSDFRLIETRNKEISMVINELEEVAFRTAGMFNDKDFENLKKMFSVERNKDSFDKEFYENDIQSLKDFMQQANSYDNRIKYLEQWTQRKEEEYKTRIVRPPAHLKKPDQEIFAQIDAPLKRARERLVSKFLINDEHGNRIEKDYKDLTSKELNTISESLVIRFYLFNYDYPAFLPQCVKAVMEHPNLLRSDKDMLKTYCQIFEVDWNLNKEGQVNKEFLSSHPIYLDGSNFKVYGEIDGKKVSDQLKRACAPFVSEAAHQLVAFNK